MRCLSGRHIGRGPGKDYSSGSPKNYHVRDLQTTANYARKAERLDFLPEMQSKVTTDCDNSSGIKYKRWGFGWVHFLKTTKTHRNLSKKLYKQQIEWRRLLTNLSELFLRKILKKF